MRPAAAPSSLPTLAKPVLALWPHVLSIPGHYHGGSGVAGALRPQLGQERCTLHQMLALPRSAALHQAGGLTAAAALPAVGAGQQLPAAAAWCLHLLPRPAAASLALAQQSLADTSTPLWPSLCCKSTRYHYRT